MYIFFSQEITHFFLFFGALYLMSYVTKLSYVTYAGNLHFFILICYNSQSCLMSDECNFFYSKNCLYQKEIEK